MKCDFCDGPRVNGAVLEKDPEAGWRINQGTENPARSDIAFACRDCASEKLDY